MEIFNKIYKDIKQLKQQDKSLVIGINGIDTSGKTEFARKFEYYLKEKSHKVQLIHIDDFLNPKKIRYYGNDEVDNYFNKSFDIKRLQENILIPIKTNNTLNKKLSLLNLESDKYDIEKKFNIDKETLVILEGVFLFREEIEPYLDYKVFIHIPFEQCKERAKRRDVPIHGEEVLRKYDTKYIPTQKYYLEKYPVEKYADIIIDNTDWNNPKVV